MNELATALMHYRQGKANLHEIDNERADVIIMLHQLDIILGKLPPLYISDKLEKLNIALNK